MEIPTRQDVLKLSQPGSGPRVSIFMPTHRAGPDTRQDPIRLKNLLTQAEDGLVEHGLRRTIAIDLLAPLRALQEDYEFWQHQSDGLAIFLDEDGQERYYRVPASFQELVLVAPRFHVKPLLPLLFEDATFYLLAISINDTRLLQCTAHSEDEVKPADLPRNMADVLWSNDPEKQNQFRAFYTGTSGGTAEFHGAGGSEPDVKDDLLRYFREVDIALAPFLRDHPAPLILACVAYLAPIYREANSYAHLVDDAVTGNPDEERSDKLREDAWQLIEPRLRGARDTALDRYRSLAGTGRTSADPAAAALAAIEGRIDTAFVTVGLQRWGSIDLEAHTVEEHAEPEPGDQDLLDTAAINTLNNGGKVFAATPDDAPEESGIAAILRY